MFTSQVDYICAAEQNAFIHVGYTVYKTKDDLSGFTALTGSLPSSGKNNCFVHKGILYAHVGFSPQYLSATNSTNVFTLNSWTGRVTIPSFDTGDWFLFGEARKTI